MKVEHWEEISQIKSIVFGSDKPHTNISVYLHGAGGFQTGYEGQYEYPDFASLLGAGKIETDQPFVVACCMAGEHWRAESLEEFLRELSVCFGCAEVDVIGFSRGGMGVYQLLQQGVPLRSATIINSRVPAAFVMPQLPVHIIHAADDQHTPLELVEEFVAESGNDLTALTVWQGDHFSIASIALSGIWRRNGVSDP